MICRSIKNLILSCCSVPPHIHETEEIMMYYKNRNFQTVPVDKLKYIENECPVCMEQLNPETEIIFVLKNCGHCFHENCIMQWILRDKNTCPLCKTKIY